VTAVASSEPSPEYARTQLALTQLLAHDLRNPLAAIVANLSFLDQVCRGAEAEVRETLGDLQASAEVLLRLIDGAVTIAALEAPEAGAARSRVSLREVARGAARAARSGRATVRVDEGGDAEVLADAAMLLTAATQLVNNGVQHSRRGGEVVLAVARGDGEAALALSDEGSPFGPPEQHFTREAQPALKHRSGGRYERGLGLYLVGLVARAYAGRVETAQEAGRSVVRLWFPLAGEEKAP